MHMFDLLLSFISVPLSTGEESDAAILAILSGGPLAGIGFYTFFYFRYRNSNKNHAFEHETDIGVLGEIGRKDSKVGHISKTRASSISGDNSGSHRSRVGRISVGQRQNP